jgi:hypothetical protein
MAILVKRRPDCIAHPHQQLYCRVNISTYLCRFRLFKIRTPAPLVVMTQSHNKRVNSEWH